MWRLETAGKNISATSRSPRSSLSLGKQVNTLTRILFSDRFQVWTIEDSSSEDGECGVGGIELKLTSCGRGLQLVDPHIPTREILHVAYLSWFACFCGIFPAQGFSPVTLVTVCPLRIGATSSRTAGETIIISSRKTTIIKLQYIIFLMQLLFP